MAALGSCEHHCTNMEDSIISQPRTTLSLQPFPHGNLGLPLSPCADPEDWDVSKEQGEPTFQGRPDGPLTDLSLRKVNYRPGMMEEEPES
jgi:hypothetical protein